MVIDVQERERQMLLDLVTGRIQEIHSEIRRSIFSTFRARLKEELAVWRAIESRLQHPESEVLEGSVRPTAGLHHPEP